jgi:endonuclease-3
MPKLRESKKARRERAVEIIRILEERYPDSKIALDYETPFQLLICTILAAQCTDAMVNKITPELFATYPTPQAFLDAPQEELERAIFKSGFYRAKAKSIKGACKALVERFGGEVPRTMEELTSLHGIGRKSANVLLGHCFKTLGVVVDTHVKRISNRLGWVESDDPEKIEYALMEIIPQEKWTRSGHLIQDFGREICIARKPKCAVCPIAALCPSAFVENPSGK